MKTTILLPAVALLTLALSPPSLDAKEKSAADFFPNKLVDANGKEVSKDSLKGKVVGIYFSAHWCPPCRLFTPSLVKFRDKNQKDFEVVFVSFDNSPKEKKAYMSHEKMKWPTLQGIHSIEENELAQLFQIPGIPTLIIIAPDGRPITPFGVEHISSDPEGALKMWQEAAGITKS